MNGIKTAARTIRLTEQPADKVMNTVANYSPSDQPNAVPGQMYTFPGQPAPEALATPWPPRPSSQPRRRSPMSTWAAAGALLAIMVGSAVVTASLWPSNRQSEAQAARTPIEIASPTVLDPEPLESPITDQPLASMLETPASTQTPAVARPPTTTSPEPRPPAASAKPAIDPPVVWIPPTPTPQPPAPTLWPLPHLPVPPAASSSPSAPAASSTPTPSTRPPTVIIRPRPTTPPVAPSTAQPKPDTSSRTPATPTITPRKPRSPIVAPDRLPRVTRD